MFVTEKKKRQLFLPPVSFVDPESQQFSLFRVRAPNRELFAGACQLGENLLTLRRMKGIFEYFLEVAKVIFLALLIVFPIRYFLFQPFIVRGASMEPSFYESDYLIVDQISYRFRDPERGEVIVFNYPQDPQKRHIKRIIGLPEEEVVIEEGRIFVTDDSDETTLLEEEYLTLSQTLGEERISLGEDEYFVMGDNRGSSFDSRNWGSLPEKNIIGRVFFQISPFSVFSRVEAPDY